MDNKNKINNIRNRITKGKEKDIIDVWHFLMSSYGWIPFDEFKNLDAGLVDELIIKLNEDSRKNNQNLKRGKGKI